MTIFIIDISALGDMHSCKRDIEKNNKIKYEQCYRGGAHGRGPQWGENKSSAGGISEEVGHF